MPEAECLQRLDTSTDKRVIIYSDAVCGSCKATRQSTGGGIVAYEGRVIKSWSSTQGRVVVSSAEAESNAIDKAACEGLGAR